MDKVAIFIDGGYLEKVLKQEHGEPRIDFAKLAKEIAQRASPGSEIIRTYYYNCLPFQGSPPTQEESERFAKKSRFFDGLGRIPRFEVRLGRLARHGPDKAGKYIYGQKMVDVLLSIDIVRMAAKNRITHAALLAGDSDFVPALRLAKEESVVLCLFHGTKAHRDLWQVADERMPIDADFIRSVIMP
jgi:uncharacterized LabA/DUF88 family protein